MLPHSRACCSSVTACACIFQSQYRYREGEREKGKGEIGGKSKQERGKPGTHCASKLNMKDILADMCGCTASGSSTCRWMAMEWRMMQSCTAQQLRRIAQLLLRLQANNQVPAMQSEALQAPHLGEPVCGDSCDRDSKFLHFHNEDVKVNEMVGANMAGCGSTPQCCGARSSFNMTQWGFEINKNAACPSSKMPGLSCPREYCPTMHGAHWGSYRHFTLCNTDIQTVKGPPARKSSGSKGGPSCPICAVTVTMYYHM